MKILVTGDKGFIGSHMVNRLKQSNHDVKTFEWGDPHVGVTGFDWVIHMGAISSTTETNVEKVLAQNYDFSMDLLDRCLLHKVNFQFSSSASVYGLGTKFTEDAPVDPRTPYAWSKYLVERHALKPEKLAHAKYNGTVIQCFRYFNVYGSNEDHKGNQASPYNQFTKQYKQTGKVKVFENSDRYCRDFIPVEQVCNTHIDFFNVPESGIWNVGTGKIKSFLDVAMSVTPNIEYIPMPDNLKNSYQAYTCADMSKTNDTLKKYAKI